MTKVIIGTDQHKASSTIEVLGGGEAVLATGRYGTDKAGYRQMVAVARQWPHRLWAVEGAGGAGRPWAQRLLADGEAVADVPAKLAARVRVLDTGQGRKTDAADAHSIAVAALRTPGLQVLAADPELVVLRLLAGRRDELSRTRAQTLNRLHRLLAELVGGVTLPTGEGDSRVRLEEIRRRREEFDNALDRLRDKMSLPSLFELNRLMLDSYHRIATNQAERSFKSSQRAMLAGFLWLLGCFGAALFSPSLEAKIVIGSLAPVGGVLSGYLGKTYIFVYERSLRQLNQFFNQPQLNNYYLTAERLIEQMSPSARDTLLQAVIEQLLEASNIVTKVSVGNYAQDGKRDNVGGKIARSSNVRRTRTRSSEPAPGSEGPPTTSS